jgi:hypothetical protein
VQIMNCDGGLAAETNPMAPSAPESPHNHLFYETLTSNNVEERGVQVGKPIAASIKPPNREHSTTVCCAFR